MASTPATSSCNIESCYLLKLPMELQLSIYELAIIQNEPLLLNCPCNSSYRSRYALEQSDRVAWENGSKLPPQQPALSRTCRLIRRVSLPLFYKHNIFRASYCKPSTMLAAPIKWLQMIGTENRELLRHLYFYDRNERQDRHRAREWKKVEEGEVFMGMGGREETLSNQLYCAHLVTFGEGGRGGKASVAVADATRLRLDGET